MTFNTSAESHSCEVSPQHLSPCYDLSQRLHGVSSLTHETYLWVLGHMGLDARCQPNSACEKIESFLIEGFHIYENFNELMGRISLRVMLWDTPKSGTIVRIAVGSKNVLMEHHTFLQNCPCAGNETWPFHLSPWHINSPRRNQPIFQISIRKLSVTKGLPHAIGIGARLLLLPLT